MTTQISPDPMINRPAAKPLPPLRLSLLYGCLVLALVVVGLLIFFFPNLLTAPGYLAILIGTTLVSLGSIGLSLAGVRARLSRPLKLLVSFAVWSFVALDVIFLVVPLFAPGPTANEVNPFAVSVQPVTAPQASFTAASPTTAPVVAAPPELALPVASPTADAVAKATEASPTSTLIPVKATEIPATVAPVKATEVPVPTKAANTPVAIAPTTKAASPPAPPTAASTARLLTGNFNNQGVEPVAGKALLGQSPDGKVVLRLENLKSANGPDLYVYLSRQANPSPAQIKDAFEVGRLKATQGNLNYELGSTFDLSQYKSVVVYCKSFSVVFGYANLS